MFNQQNISISSHKKSHFFRRFKTQFLRSFPSIQSTDTDARTIFRSHVKNSKDICRKNIGLRRNSESEENQHWGSNMGFHGQSKGIQNIRCISLCVSGSAWTDFDPSGSYLSYAFLDMAVRTGLKVPHSFFGSLQHLGPFFTFHF